ncbi:unnamed protein product [Polarella glacialis]|uniref:C3H1-type domain-containing protein n=1 Tax=Polarella glacialis TaxID=89957 RepID=A0A813J3D3_POLGL|nr:unnamed protein product [Polarella glacialis]
MGNNGLTLQSYTSDISSAADCPDRLAYLGAAMVIGMCVGSVMVSVTDVMQASFRVCYWVAVTMNMGIVLVVAFVWRDVAPRKSFRVAEAHPAAGIWILKSCRAMTLYALLIFLASFSVNMYSSLAYYCHNILMMPINMVVLLGVLWALTAAFCLAVVQPFLAGKYGEINTLKIASPMAVGLAAREVNAEDQGSLMGAVSILETTGKIVAPLLASDILIPMFVCGAWAIPWNCIVYFVAALIVMPGIAVAASNNTRWGFITHPCFPPLAISLSMSLRPAQKDPTVDKAYDQIDHFLEGLKKKSLDINRTLDHHNVMIPEIASSARHIGTKDLAAFIDEELLRDVPPALVASVPLAVPLEEREVCAAVGLADHGRQALWALDARDPNVAVPVKVELRGSLSDILSRLASSDLDGTPSTSASSSAAEFTPPHLPVVTQTARKAAHRAHPECQLALCLQPRWNFCAEDAEPPDLAVCVPSAGLSPVLAYRTDLFDEATAAVLARHAEALLRRRADWRQLELGESLQAYLAEEERRQLLVDWQGKQVPFSEDLCVHQLFERVARGDAAGRIAVQGFGPHAKSWTYAELDVASCMVAEALLSLGVRPGGRTPLLVRRSLSLLAAVYGALRAGQAYVPLDPDWPQGRTVDEYFLEELSLYFIAFSGKGCFTCGGDHFARDCPEGGGGGGKSKGKGKKGGKSSGCFTCGGDHLARDCPEGGGGGYGGGESYGKGKGGGKSVDCFNCGGDHFARDCPEGGKSKGKGKGKKGGGKSVDCFNCGGDHFARDCPDGSGKGKGTGKGKGGGGGGGICFDFRDNGECKFGDECRFSHE